MMMHVKTEADGRICAVSGRYMGPGDQLIEWIEGIPLDDHRDYKVVDGVLVHEPLPVPEYVPDQVGELRAENTLLRAQVQALSDRGEFMEDCIAEMATKVYGGV